MPKMATDIVDLDLSLDQIWILNQCKNNLTSNMSKEMFSSLGIIVLIDSRGIRVIFFGYWTLGTRSFSIDTCAFLSVTVTKPAEGESIP